jgi:hypothetical protein
VCWSRCWISQGADTLLSIVISYLYGSPLAVDLNRNFEVPKGKVDREPVGALRDTRWSVNTIKKVESSSDAIKLFARGLAKKARQRRTEEDVWVAESALGVEHYAASTRGPTTDLP